MNAHTLALRQRRRTWHETLASHSNTLSLAGHGVFDVSAQSNPPSVSACSTQDGADRQCANRESFYREQET